MAKKKVAKPKAVSSVSQSPSSLTAKRKHIRFGADQGHQALIVGDHKGKALKTVLPALLVEESFKGCSLIALQNKLFDVGTRFKVKVGQLDAMMAEVRWIKSYDGKFCHFGLVYEE